jgi:hypothetical protein
MMEELKASSEDSLKGLANENTGSLIKFSALLPFHLEDLKIHHSSDSVELEEFFKKASEAKRAEAEARRKQAASEQAAAM